MSKQGGADQSTVNMYLLSDSILAVSIAVEGKCDALYEHTCGARLGHDQPSRRASSEMLREHAIKLPLCDETKCEGDSRLHRHIAPIYW